MTSNIQSSDILIREALAYEAQAFEADDCVNGADLVEWFSQWRERAKAMMLADQLQSAAALQLIGDEPIRFRNFYRHCGQAWQDTWSCACNDDCPVCGAEIEPCDSIELQTDPDEKGM